MKLQKHSGNPLLHDKQQVSQGETVSVADNSHLGFADNAKPDKCFLVLALKFRSHDAVKSQGPHPAIQVAMQREASGKSFHHASQPVNMPSTGTAAAVLECVTAKGTDVQKMVPDARVIALSLEESIDIGRQHQVGFFEHLLQAEPRWLTFISRAHCRVQLTDSIPATGRSSGQGAGFQQPPGGNQRWLKVENLSTNPINIGGRLLRKGKEDVICEGGSLIFVAAGGDGKEQAFLELRLRRARA